MTTTKEKSERTRVTVDLVEDNSSCADTSRDRPNYYVQSVHNRLSNCNRRIEPDSDELSATIIDVHDRINLLNQRGK